MTERECEQNCIGCPFKWEGKGLWDLHDRCGNIDSPSKIDGVKAFSLTYDSDRKVLECIWKYQNGSEGVKAIIPLR